MFVFLEDPLLAHPLKWVSIGAGVAKQTKKKSMIMFAV
jgi:hypothetical protein